MTTKKNWGKKCIFERERASEKKCVSFVYLGSDLTTLTICAHKVHFEVRDFCEGRGRVSCLLRCGPYRPSPPPPLTTETQSDL